jgi:hypothetical protein
VRAKIMAWQDILKYDNVSNMSTTEFGNKVIDALEALGFEIKYSDYYPKPNTYRATDKQVMREGRFREFTTLTEEDLEGYDGGGYYGDFGHELIITDMDEPFTYGQGMGTDTLTINYLPNDYDLYNNPRHEDYPVQAINSWKVHSIKLTTQGGKKKIDVKLDLKGWNNNLSGVRELTKAILEAFKKYGQYEEDWSDMSEQEQREYRGEMAGHRFAAGARSLGYRDGY